MDYDWFVRPACHPERSEGSELRAGETFFSIARSFGFASEPALSEVEGMTKSMPPKKVSESV